MLKDKGKSPKVLLYMIYSSEPLDTFLFFLSAAWNRN